MENLTFRYIMSHESVRIGRFCVHLDARESF